MDSEVTSKATETKISGWQALPKWSKVTTIALAVIALGFGISLLRSSQAIVGSVHKRNFHIVTIAARGLETWPRDVAVMARNNASLAKAVNPDDMPRLNREAAPLMGDKGSGSFTLMEYQHPDLGDFRIHYRDDCAAAPNVKFSDGILPGQGTQFVVQGQFSNRPSGDYNPKGKTSCFSVAVPLDRLVNMRFDNREIRNFLIVARDGRVIRQLGDGGLPIVSIGKLGANNGLAHGIVANVTGEKEAAAVPVGLDEVRNVAPITIGGTEYLAYIKPFILESDDAACAPEEKSAPEKERTPAAKGANQCFAVALMPARSMRQSWLSPPPTLTIGFGLALAAFLALLPLIRLLLIGGSESVSGIEVLGIMLGLPAAITIAAFAIQFAIDVKSERTVAERETGAVAHRLARQAGEEIGEALSAAFDRKDSNALSEAVKRCPPETLSTLHNCPDGFGAGNLQLELFLKIGADGKLAPNTQSYAFRNNATASFDVSAREYFLRLRSGGGFELQNPDKSSSLSGAPCPPFDGKRRFTIDQVRSQTDGYDKTVLALPCPDQDADNSALMVLTLKAFLAPVLPNPLHFLVIDSSRPDMPVIFHEARGHAGVEAFLEQAELSAAQAGQLMQLGSAPNAPPDFTFRARYAGERTIFSAVRVGNTPWLVLTWQRADDADGIAARTASRAMVAWVAIALIFLVTCVTAIAVTGSAWRQFWPHESACAAYVHLSKVFATAAMALLVKLVLVQFGYGQIGVAIFLAFMLCLWLWDVNHNRMTAVANGDTPKSPWRTAALAAMPDMKGWNWFSRAILLLILLGYPLNLIFYNSSFFATVGLWAFAPVYAAWQLEAPKDSDDPLAPATENAYRNALLAFFACVALVPSIMLWNQGRALSHHLADNERLVAAKHALVTRAEIAAGIRRAIFLSATQATATQSDQRGLPSPTTSSGKLTDAWAPYFASLLWELQTGVPIDKVPTCAGAGGSVWLCHGSLKLHSDPGFAHGVVQRKMELPPTVFVAFGIPVAIALLLVFVWAATTRTLDALAGFHVPLGAVKERKIRLAKPGEVGGWKRLDNKPSPKPGEKRPIEGLPTRTLLVAPQQAARNRLTNYPEAWAVDLADLLLDKEGAELRDKAIKDAFIPERKDKGKGNALLVASGLELILRDIPRRHAALKFLETAEKRLADGKLAGIIVIAEMSPLERILDAFESGGTADESMQITREELRWARLFQIFESIIFAPIDKIGVDQFPENLPPPVWRLIAETRWLPAVVIDGTTGTNRTAELSADQGEEFPLDPEIYQNHYRDDILEWALAVDPCSEAAAIDHLRSTLIEHYEQCWVASTLAERLVLDAIARGHFVNIARALPLQSLVRRGLVVLDPSPRLMNRSFALFVRQAERPNTLAIWRKNLPRSNWMAARLPLLIAIPMAVVGLTLAAAESGQELTAIFSVLAAGAPALLSTLFKTVRPA